MTEMNDAEKILKSKGTIGVKFTIPILMWEEWKKDCVNNFNDNYYSKLWFDHMYRADTQTLMKSMLNQIVMLEDELFELKAVVAEIGAPDAEEEKKTKTFGEK